MTTLDPRGLASIHESALLQAAQRDDQRAQEELLRRYEPLVRAAASRLHPPCGCDRRDLAQDGQIGLLAAIRAWKPGRGPFRPFAACCVRNHLTKALAAARAPNHRLLDYALLLGRPAPESETDAVLHRLPSTNPRDDPVAMLLVHDHLDRLLAAVATLTAKERDALAGALAGKSCRQLAAEYGWTIKAVERALRRARDKLAVAQALTT